MNIVIYRKHRMDAFKTSGYLYGRLAGLLGTDDLKVTCNGFVIMVKDVKIDCRYGDYKTLAGLRVDYFHTNDPEAATMLTYRHGKRVENLDEIGEIVWEHFAPQEVKADGREKA